eukprot:scaffold32283_cov22-Tisochrysis_lutea.AAC.1
MLLIEQGRARHLESGCAGKVALKKAGDSDLGAADGSRQRMAFERLLEAFLSTAAAAAAVPFLIGCVWLQGEEAHCQRFQMHTAIFDRDAEHKEQKQELEQDLELEPSPFERRLHAIEEAPTEATSTPVTSVDNCLVTIGGSVAVEGATAAVVADPEPASLDQDAPLAGTQPC